MSVVRVSLLSREDCQAVHDAAIRILRDTGVVVNHGEALTLLAQAGAAIHRDRQIARLPEALVMQSVASARKSYILHGRTLDCVARFGQGDRVLMSSPGQYLWLDERTGQRRPCELIDLHNAIRLGDALPHVNIVGAMATVAEVPVAWRDVFLTAELIKGTTKPTRTWIANGRSAAYILELYRTVAGGAAALRAHPMTEAFLEPISPLELPHEGLDIALQFARAGLPVCVGPMAMTTGTAPGTLAGTLALENAEILAGITMAQIAAPGTPVMYGGIPHVMDPRTSICSFGSPEQGLMAIGMVEMARFYGFPSYVNVGLTDSKRPDAQAGIEKAGSLVLGMLAGADMFGHAGICGTDHAASLIWLLLDNELMAYAKRIVGGLEISSETLAADVIARIGPSGHFFDDAHTARHFRREIWVPGKAWTRDTWDGWAKGGSTSMAERLSEGIHLLLTRAKPTSIDEALRGELDRILQAAQHDLG